MKRSKENVVSDFQDMIINSWTFNRLTMNEKKQLERLFEKSVPVQNSVKGTYKQRWDILQAIYTGFIYGTGYTGWNWREQATEPQPF